MKRLMTCLRPSAIRSTSKNSRRRQRAPLGQETLENRAVMTGLFSSSLASSLVSPSLVTNSAAISSAAVGSMLDPSTVVASGGTSSAAQPSALGVITAPELRFSASARFDAASGRLTVTGTFLGEELRVKQYDGQLFVERGTTGPTWLASLGNSRLAISTPTGSVSSISADRVKSIVVSGEGGDDRLIYEMTDRDPNSVNPMLQTQASIASLATQSNSTLLSGITLNQWNSSIFRATQFERLIPVELRGGDGNDTLRVSAQSPAVLSGGYGNDSLTGGGGHDQLRGDAGNDILSGESGNDHLQGGSGQDTLWGGTGNDVLSGGQGNDRLYGQVGHDQMFGDGGDDYLSGSDGSDQAYGGDGHDTIYGGNGHDRMLGGYGDDSLLAGAGNDQVWGDAGNDYVEGGDGEDRLTGGFENDVLFGDAGDDWVWGDEGDDALDGGWGTDFLFGGHGINSLSSGNGLGVVDSDAVSAGAIRPLGGGMVQSTQASPVRIAVPMNKPITVTVTSNAKFQQHVKIVNPETGAVLVDLIGTGEGAQHYTGSFYAKEFEVHLEWRNHRSYNNVYFNPQNIQMKTEANSITITGEDGADTDYNDSVVKFSWN